MEQKLNIGKLYKVESPVCHTFVDQNWEKYRENYPSLGYKIKEHHKFDPENSVFLYLGIEAIEKRGCDLNGKECHWITQHKFLHNDRILYTLRTDGIHFFRQPKFKEIS